MKISDYSCKFYNGDKTLNNYLNDIRKYTVPTLEEEEALFERIADGDEAAKKEIVERNQRFVYSLAKIYSKDESEVLDYVNEGNIGLITAIDSFDPTKGIKFITYAVWYIRRSMNYYLTNTNSLITKSNSMKLGKKIDKVKQVFFNENGYLPTTEDIVELVKKYYDIDVKDVSDIYDLRIASINDEVSDDYTVEENSMFNEKTSSENEYETESNETYNSMLVNDILSRLTPKQQDIIKMAYGIGYERSYTPVEIGAKYNMDEITINQLKSNIMEYLRDNRGEYKLAI
jgi:RNA polymerase primary sigma factor